MSQRLINLGVAAMLIGAAPTAAVAGDASGVWLRENGASKVRFAACGQALCGSVIWLRDADSPAHVGQQVFFGMTRTSDNEWEGQAFNPEDGKTYSGKMLLSGSSLTTSGCALAGLICKHVRWKRLN